MMRHRKVGLTAELAKEASWIAGSSPAKDSAENGATLLPRQ
jgi:hypothetical protein